MHRRTSPSPPATVAAARFNVHGLIVEVSCALPGLRQVMADVLGPLQVLDLPAGFQPIEGSVDVYDADVVARHISPQAERFASFGDYAELWRDGERCWLLDDGWGLCEINFIRRSFRSWVLPQTHLNAIRAVDQAVLWPAAQVMLTRGLALLPAASVAHRGRGALLVSPFSLEPELSAILDAGHGLIGQRWTAIREEDGRPLMLAMPGRIERAPAPQLRSRASAILSIQPQQSEWIDLAANAATRCNYSWCDVIFVVEPGRRAVPRATPLTGASATAAIRRAWPMPDVGPSNRQAQLATRLAQQCRVYQVELSRDPRAILRLLDDLPTDVSFSRAKLAPSVPIAPRRIAV